MSPSWLIVEYFVNNHVRASVYMNILQYLAVISGLLSLKMDGFDAKFVSFST